MTPTPPPATPGPAAESAPAAEPRGFSSLRLASQRLRLRPLQAADAPAVYAMYADPVTMRYWSTPPWTEARQADELIARNQVAMAAGDFLCLGLALTGDDRLIGVCTLFAFHLPSRRCEIGYMLQRDCWGQGLMHEAMSTLLNFGFSALDLNRVEADIDPRNSGSRRTLQRLGFIEEGRLRQRWIVDGEVSDSALYGLLRSDWLAWSTVDAAPSDGARPQQG